MQNYNQSIIEIINIRNWYSWSSNNYSS